MRRSSIGAILAAAAVPFLAGPVPSTHADTIHVESNGTYLGEIEVEIPGGFTPDRILGDFRVAGGRTLAEAALVCGRHHFTWYQIVTWSDAHPEDAGGVRLSYPWPDPPPGGYLDDPETTGFSELRWADDRPGYYDEGDDPPAGTPGWQDGQSLADHVEGDTLLTFVGLPLAIPGKILSHKTWLAAVAPDGRGPRWLGGFGWEWVGSKVANFKVVCDPPSEEEYEAFFGP
jgi:hypothetical protein